MLLVDALDADEVLLELVEEVEEEILLTLDSDDKLVPASDNVDEDETSDSDCEDVELVLLSLF